MLKLEELVPQSYRENSYDFFIYTKLLGIIFDSGLLNSYNNATVSQSLNTQDKYIDSLFRDKVTNYDNLPNEYKRFIVRSYYDITMWRGTEKSIQLVLGLYKTLTHCEEISYIMISEDVRYKCPIKRYNKETGEMYVEKKDKFTQCYTVSITVKGNLYEDLLDCLLELVLPPSIKKQYLRVSSTSLDSLTKSTVGVYVKIHKHDINPLTMLSFGSNSEETYEWSNKVDVKYDASDYVDSTTSENDYYKGDYPNYDNNAIQNKMEPNGPNINPIIITHTAGQTLYSPNKE